MIIAIPKESYPNECRIALVPSLISHLTDHGHRVLIEKGAGVPAGFLDAEYVEKGATVIDHRERLFQEADTLFMVRGPGANDKAGDKDLALIKSGQVLIAFLNPLMNASLNEVLAVTGVTAFSLELIPRIARAQSMDALSSMASLAGYKGVLLAANALPKIFPLMITAAGSLMPAKVFVIGAGVTGLQACATAKRMGALVSAYDIRPAVKDQVKSVGAQFIEFELPEEPVEDQRGYAKSLSTSFYQRQQDEMTKVLKESDVVIATAGVPGKKAPVLITDEMVQAMKPQSVIVDVVADLGGNCAVTEFGKTIVRHGVTIMGPENLPSQIAFHASQMIAKNIVALFDHLTDIEGGFSLNMKEEITLSTLLCKDRAVINERVLEAFHLVK